MSNSKLVSLTRISPNKSNGRTHNITRITIHCFVGQVTVERGLEVFADQNRRASCNYVIGKDGKIGLCVNESDRSWCSSNADNDNRAVTIEVASDTVSPYTVTEEAYASLLNLVEDIARRNGKDNLIWFGDKDKSTSYLPKDNELVLTVHRWFANKACPGQYLLDKHHEIVRIVNNRLRPSSGKLYRVQVGAFSNLDNAKRLESEIRAKGYSTIIKEE